MIKNNTVQGKETPPSLPIAIGTSPTGEGVNQLSPLGEIGKGVL